MFPPTISPESKRGHKRKIASLTGKNGVERRRYYRASASLGCSIQSRPAAPPRPRLLVVLALFRLLKPVGKEVGHRKTAHLRPRKKFGALGDTEGCILPGKSVRKIQHSSGTAQIGVTASRRTMQSLLQKISERIFNSSLKVYNKTGAERG